MKKTIALLTVILMAACILTSCSSEARINEHEWVMTLAQSEDGSIVAFDPSYNVDASYFEDADGIVLTCKAKSGKLTLTDGTNEKSYNGKYKKTESDEASATYDITVGDTKGTAIVSMSKYHDGESVPTLIIAVGGYALSFRAK